MKLLLTILPDISAWTSCLLVLLFPQESLMNLFMCLITSGLYFASIEFNWNVKFPKLNMILGCVWLFISALKLILVFSR